MLLTQCPVCKDTLVRGADIVAAPCGHTYHEFCLREWLKTKSNCPQCRKMCQSNRVKRLYFDFVEEESFSQTGDAEREVAKLREIVETVRGKLTHTESLLEDCQANQATTLQELQTTREALDTNERKLRKQRERNDQQRIELRQQMELLQQAMMEKAEVEELRQQMDTMKDVEKLVKGTTNEARELIRVFEEQAETDCSQAAMRHLAKLVAILRSELDSVKAEKREVRKDRHRLEKELARARRQMAEETSATVAAKQELDQEKAHVAWLERERDSLRIKVEKMANAIRSPSADTVSSLARRVAFESPMVQQASTSAGVASCGDEAEVSVIDLFESTDDLSAVQKNRVSVDSNYFETPSPACQSGKRKKLKQRPAGNNPFAVKMSCSLSAEEVENELEEIQPSPLVCKRAASKNFNILRSHLLNSGALSNKPVKRADYNGLGSRQTASSIIHPSVRQRTPLKQKRKVKAKTDKKFKKCRSGVGQTLDNFVILN